MMNDLPSTQTAHAARMEAALQQRGVAHEGSRRLGKGPERRRALGLPLDGRSPCLFRWMPEVQGEHEPECPLAQGRKVAAVPFRSTAAADSPPGMRSIAYALGLHTLAILRQWIRRNSRGVQHRRAGRGGPPVWEAQAGLPRHRKPPRHGACLGGGNRASLSFWRTKEILYQTSSIFIYPSINQP